jgi:hypothetical protein
VTQVPLLIDEPKGRKSGLTVILAHGAGAGMESGFMREIAEAHGVASPGPEVMVSLVWGGLVGLLKSADQNFVRLDPQLVEAAGLVLWCAVTGTAASSVRADPVSDRSLPSLHAERKSP